MMSAKKGRKDVIVELVHKHIPKELEDFQVQRRQRYEKSYDMEMDSPTVPGPIEEQMTATLHEHFDGKSYDATEMARKAVEVADAIKNDTMGLVSQRVRLVSQVLVGEKQGEELRAISRCVWDVEKDRYMRAVFENQELFVVATLFALYYE